MHGIGPQRVRVDGRGLAYSSTLNIASTWEYMYLLCTECHGPSEAAQSLKLFASDELYLEI